MHIGTGYLVWSPPWDVLGTTGYFRKIVGTSCEVIVETEDQVELSFSRTWDSSLEGIHFSSDVVPIDVPHSLRIFLECENDSECRSAMNSDAHDDSDTVGVSEATPGNSRLLSCILCHAPFVSFDIIGLLAFNALRKYLRLPINNSVISCLSTCFHLPLETLSTGIHWLSLYH
ncbi:rhamnogalacturonate lyase [Tanacetum coccineum]